MTATNMCSNFVGFRYSPPPPPPLKQLYVITERLIMTCCGQGESQSEETEKEATPATCFK